MIQENNKDLENIQNLNKKLIQIIKSHSQNKTFTYHVGMTVQALQTVGLGSKMSGAQNATSYRCKSSNAWARIAPRVGPEKYKHHFEKLCFSRKLLDFVVKVLNQKMRNTSSQHLVQLQKNPKNIRNICILAHVDHGTP